MIQQAAAALAELYESDETAWLEAMADLIRQERFGDLDFVHLQEYLADMARRDRREVKSRMTVLLAHLLKWTYQPAHRSRSWRATIIEQRQELTSLAGQGVLRNHAEAILAEVYKDAVERAAAETGLAIESLPAACPYTLEQLLSADVPEEERPANHSGE